MVMKHKNKVVLIVFLALSLFCYGHSGRTDSRGGHHNRISGGYHYHHGACMHINIQMEDVRIKTIVIAIQFGISLVLEL